MDGRITVGLVRSFLITNQDTTYIGDRNVVLVSLVCFVCRF